MKVLDLQCPLGHRFEGWFASADDFESQLSRKLIECPICSATEVSRMPSAPRLNLSGATRTRQGEAQPGDVQRAQAAEGSGKSGGVDGAPAGQHAREFEAMA